jgi:hypothetical protein
MVKLWEWKKANFFRVKGTTPSFHWMKAAHIVVKFYRKYLLQSRTTKHPHKGRTNSFFPELEIKLPRKQVKVTKYSKRTCMTGARSKTIEVPFLKFCLFNRCRHRDQRQMRLTPKVHPLLLLKISIETLTRCLAPSFCLLEDRSSANHSKNVIKPLSC